MKQKRNNSFRLLPLIFALTFIIGDRSVALCQNNVSQDTVFPYTESILQKDDTSNNGLEDGQYFYGEGEIHLKQTLFRVISAQNKTCSLLKYGGNINNIHEGDPHEVPSSVITNGEEYRIIELGLHAYAWQTSMAKLIIPEGIIVIGDGAFEGCSNLRQVSFPESLERLGDEAFMDCQKLIDVSLHNNVKSIGKKAFMNCSSMWRGSIHGIVGDEAYAGCDSLTTLDVSPDVVSIGSDAFKGCEILESVRVSDIEQWFEIDFTNEYSNPLSKSRRLTDSNSLKPIESIIIPEGTSSLKDYCLYNYAGLTELSVPESVRTIGKSAFANCSALEKLDLGKPLDIGDGFLSGCDMLTYITIQTSIPPVCNSESFNGFDRAACRLLVPEGSKKTYAGNVEWSKFGKITEYDFEIVLDKYEAKLEPGESIQLSASISNPPYEDYVLVWSSSDESVATVDNYGKIDAISEGTAHITVTDVDEIAKATCTVTVEYIWQEGPEYSYTYNGQTLKYSILNPDEHTAELINASDISGNVEIPETIRINGVSYSVTRIGNKAFYNNKNLQSVNLPETIIEIGSMAFFNCSMTSLNIPQALRRVEKSAFQAAIIKSVYFSSLKSIFTIQYEDHYRAFTKADELYINGAKITDLIIDDEEIEEIPQYAFRDVRCLNSVTIGGNVRHIGEGSFAFSNITSVKIGDSVTSIGSYAFNGCKKLKELKIGESVKKIDRCAFIYCSELESVVLPNALEELGEETFNGCTKLSELVLSSSLKTIGDRVFFECDIRDIIIPPLVESIGINAFAASSLQNYFHTRIIVLGHRLKNLSIRAFNSEKYKNPYAPDPTLLYVTAQTPPISDSDNVFLDYSNNKLYVQEDNIKKSYVNSEYCWRLFNDINTIPVKPSKFTINKTSISGNAGDKIQLTAKMQPANVTLPYIFWRSTDPSIATVDHNGLVTIHKDYDEVKGSGLNGCKIIAETIYANTPILEVVVNKTPSSVTEIGADNPSASDMKSEIIKVYNLQGTFIKSATGEDYKNNLRPGVYIIRIGNETKKIII